MWFGMFLMFLFFFGFILSFIYSAILTFVKNKEKKKKINNKLKYIIFTVIGFAFLLTIIFSIGGFRIDFVSGQHVIIPTAIDTDFWGNYKVYYKTTMYESNSSEGYYMIEKEKIDLVEQIQTYIKNRKEIIVYYDKWVGFKGISSPTEAPIVKIEEMD